jgi:pimeloyl-ACP methyl ester carboxylesterase
MRKRDVALAIGGAAAAAVAVKMLTRADSVRFEDVRHLVPHSDRSRFVNVDGIRIHYQEFGDDTRPAMLLIHGYTASAYVWRHCVHSFVDAGFYVLAIDLVGFGYSEKPRWFEYSIDAQARIVERFLDHLGIGRASLVGSSYGGAVAATLALDYPERVDKLVLVDAVINDDLKKHPILRLVEVPVVGEMITPFLADSYALHRWRMSSSLAPCNLSLVTNDRINAIRRPLSAADGHHSLLATSRNWHAGRITRDAHLISQPTLIVWGEDDTVIPASDGERLHEAISDSRFVLIKNSGHIPQEERSEVFAAVVSDFARHHEP